MAAKPLKFAISNISLDEIYVAYRKAKAEAFYETTHFRALAFTRYEQRLDANLRVLLERLQSGDLTWLEDVVKLGSYAYIPKSIDGVPKVQTDEMFYACLDPLDEWQRL